MIAATHTAMAAAGATCAGASARAGQRTPSVASPRPSPSPTLPPTATAPLSSSRRRARLAIVVPSAKKPGGGGKAQKKGGGALADLMRKKEADAAGAEPGWDAAGGGASAEGEGGAGGGVDGGAPPAGPATPAQFADPELLMDLLSVCQSYWKHTGTALLEGVELDALARALYEAPFVCLAHNRFEAEAAQADAGAGAGAGASAAQQETVFTYANRAALTLFEGTWDEIVGMPSRLSADDSPEAQQERDRLLEAAAKGGAANGQGIVRNYSGWRRSLKGARFLIRDATLFNVSDLSGDLWGQAVVFDEYETEDGRKVKVVAGGSSGSAAAASPEALAAAEAAVAEQGAAVRALKDSGKGNADAEVGAAVDELKRRKDVAASIAARLGPSAISAAPATAAAAAAAPAEAAAEDGGSGL